MKILFWQGSDDGSSWYRCVQPAQALQWLGHETVSTQHITAELIDAADILIVSRPAKPKAHEIIKHFITTDRPVIGDLDDDYFVIDESNTVARAFWTSEMLAGLADGLRLCTEVTVPSQVLSKELFVRVGHPAPIVIPNGLHAAWLGAPRTYDKPEITLGWAGSQNTAAWLPMIAPVINKMITQYSNVKFLAVGITLTDVQSAGITLVKNRIGATGWVPFGDEYLKACHNFDIWLAPYGDTPFNQAKFPTKALEAGFLGIPLVASGIEPYQQWLGSNGEYGFTVRQDYQWSRALKPLIEKPTIRRWVGENARAHASSNIMQSLGLHWQSVIREAVCA
jgi:glycosyltransferase involved in cell wall biosynthesis